jgi:aldehyde:ferredoxin oxidoreductase
MAELVSAMHGVAWSEDNVRALGRRALLDERDFNRRAGVPEGSAAIPSWLREEPLQTPDGPQTFDLPDELVDAFWAFE